jgi:hypothetical protein
MEGYRWKGRGNEKGMNKGYNVHLWK